MLYIRGDTHGDPEQLQAMPGESTWTREDILIVTGDFGFVFRGEENSIAERTKLDALAQKPYRILFVDGNHEGFPYLRAYPEQQLYGAPVRRIRENIFWLQRGYIYQIQDHSFFVMGGAYSMDKAFRMQHYAIHGEAIWFAEELPCGEEYRRAIENLKNADMRVDYILTHTAPRTVIPRVIHAMPDPNDGELTGFLDWVYHEVTFRKWFFGHFHEDLQINDQMIACLQKVHTLP